MEGSLADLAAVRSVAYFTWNSQSFAERWARRGGLAVLALARPALFLIHKRFATRVLHTLLRGVTRDRLDLLGEEYFKYVLKPQLKPRGVEKIQGASRCRRSHRSRQPGTGRVMRPLARFLGVDRILTNRLEFRDGVATGRLLEPMISPRGAFALIAGGAAGRTHRRRESCASLEEVSQGNSSTARTVGRALRSLPQGRHPPALLPIVLTDTSRPKRRFPVRETLRGKHLMLVGVTGFIGKVWLAQILDRGSRHRQNLSADSPAALDHLRAALRKNRAGIARL